MSLRPTSIALAALVCRCCLISTARAASFASFGDSLVSTSRRGMAAYHRLGCGGVSAECSDGTVWADLLGRVGSRRLLVFIPSPRDQCKTTAVRVLVRP